METIEETQHYTDEDFDRLWNKHIPFVATRLRRFNIPLSDSDAWQEAKIAMLKTMRRYDPSRNVKFISLYGVYLDNALKDYLRLEHATVYPKHAYRLKCKPSILDVISLDATVIHRTTGESSYKLIDVIADSCNPYRDLDIQSIQDEILHRIRSILTDKERFILESYYGLNGKHLSMREIGHQIGVSGEAIRQQLNKIKHKLQQHLLSDPHFEDLLDTYFHDKYLNEEEPRCTIPLKTLSTS